MQRDIPEPLLKKCRKKLNVFEHITKFLCAAQSDIPFLQLHFWFSI